MIRVLSNVETAQPLKASLERLQAFALFDSLPKVARRDVARRMKWVSVSEGFSIIEPYEPINDVYFLFTGKVGVINAAGDGVRLHMATVTAGQFFGELPAIDGCHDSTAAIAQSDSILGVLNGQVFAKLTTQYGQLAATLHAKLVERVRHAEQRVVAMSRYTAEQRVCMELADHMEPDPADTTRRRIFPVPTQIEIAETIGATRQTVARAFGRLIRGNVIERRGRVLLVHDYKKLETAAFTRKAA